MINKKIKAISIIELSVVLIICSIIYLLVNSSMGKNALEQENFKSTALASYAILNKVTENELISGGFENKIKSENDVLQLISNATKAVKACYNAKEELCWSENWLWGSTEKAGIQLKTLQYITADFISSSCDYNKNIPNTCAFVYIDTNGANLPNQVGKDILLFYMTKQGFIPAGIDSDTITKREDCDIENNKYSWGCTAVILGLK